MLFYNYFTLTTSIIPPHTRNNKSTHLKLDLLPDVDDVTIPTFSPLLVFLHQPTKRVFRTHLFKSPADRLFPSPVVYLLTLETGSGGEVFSASLLSATHSTTGLGLGLGLELGLGLGLKVMV